MGHTRPQPTAATALAHGIAAKIAPVALALTCTALVAWAAVVHTLVIDADSRLVLAAVGAAISFIVAAVASWCMVVFRVIVDGHADRMESAAHFQVAGIRQEVRNVNWLTTNKFRGEARAFIDAANAYGDPSETGPMRIINGAG